MVKTSAYRPARHRAPDHSGAHGGRVHGTLAATVSNAGARGGFGGTDSSPEALREVIRAIRRLTNRPFIINLYLDRSEPYVRVAKHEAALKVALAPAHAELHAGEVPDAIDLLGKFDSQIAVVIEERVPVLSTHFGAPDARRMRVLKANGTRVIATATTVGEARQLASAGVDAIIAQGSEAGGHRGTFGPGRPRSARWRWCRRLPMPWRFPLLRQAASWMAAESRPR